MILLPKKTVILALCIFLISANVFAAEKLIFSIDLVRHGDRTPLAPIPKAALTWNHAFGELTDQGKEQEYALGKKLRKKYIEQYHFLSGFYDPNAIYVFSTNKHRTQQSANALLLGLYPLDFRPAFQKQVPIHITYQKDSLLTIDPHQLFIPSSKDTSNGCALYLANQSKLKDWGKLSGMSLSDCKSFLQFADNISIRVLHHRSLPKGLTKQDALAIISTGNDILTHLFTLKHVTDTTGKNFIRFITHYLNLAQQKRTKIKYMLFSAHDVTILAIMNTLGVPLKSIPPYASQLNISFFTNNHQNYIQVNYNDKPVLLPLCKGNQCTLKQFAQFSV